MPRSSPWARALPAATDTGRSRAATCTSSSGDQDDWAYGAHGIFALTIELPKGAAQALLPDRSEVNKFNSQNLNAALWFLQQADCPYAAAGLAQSLRQFVKSGVLLAVGL